MSFHRGSVRIRDAHLFRSAADKLTRNAAIMTVKRWVPDTRPLTNRVVSFALALYARLEAAPEPEPTTNEGEDGGGEEDMAMDATPPPEPVKAPFALVVDGEVKDRLDPPKAIGGVVQHVELLLALCVKDPELLTPCVSVLCPTEEGS